jgi:hypothetical protein
MKERLEEFRDQRFSCQRCGECCRSRNVPLTMKDIKQISRQKGPEEFIVIHGERKLVLDRREWDSGCVFLNDTQCTIHAMKPLVCELYPVCISEKSLLEGSDPVTLQDGSPMYLYVDSSCRGVGQGDILNKEMIKEKALALRMHMLGTDLGSLVGWITDEKEDEKV